MAPFTWVSNCFNLILLRAGWTRILSEQVSADENRKFFCVLSCPMVSWPPVFTLACPNSAPRCLKKMATAKTFHLEKDTCCTVQCAQRRHEPTVKYGAWNGKAHKLNGWWFLMQRTCFDAALAHKECS